MSHPNRRPRAGLYNRAGYPQLTRGHFAFWAKIHNGCLYMILVSMIPQKTTRYKYHNGFTLSTNLIKKNIDLSQWISQAEAARLRGVTRQAIAKLVRKGKLKTLEIGGYSFVHKQEILKFKDGPAGRPKTKHGESPGNQASDK